MNYQTEGALMPMKDASTTLKHRSGNGAHGTINSKNSDA